MTKHKYPQLASIIFFVLAIFAAFMGCFSILIEFPNLMWIAIAVSFWGLAAFILHRTNEIGTIIEVSRAGIYQKRPLWGTSNLPWAAISPHWSNITGATIKLSDARENNVVKIRPSISEFDLLLKRVRLRQSNLWVVSGDIVFRRTNLALVTRIFTLIFSLILSVILVMQEVWFPLLILVLLNLQNIVDLLRYPIKVAFFNDEIQIRWLLKNQTIKNKSAIHSVYSENIVQYNFPRLAAIIETVDRQKIVLSEMDKNIPYMVDVLNCWVEIDQRNCA